jgi:hypothetical protein
MCAIFCFLQHAHLCPRWSKAACAYCLVHYKWSWECPCAGDGKSSGHVLDDYYGSRGLRRLVLAAGEEGPSGDVAARFATQLWAHAFRGRCKDWLTPHQHALKVPSPVLALFV